MSARAIRITLSGYYGSGNTGDEAVLAGIVESFARRAQAAEFTVFSADPSDTARRHGLRAVRRTDLRAMGAALTDCDILLSGGGSLFQDATSLRSLIYYLAVVRLARLYGKPVMLYAQGIGPLRRRSARLLTRRAADRVSYITVRDADSQKLLREIGVARPPIEVTADPAFALTPASKEEVERIVRSEQLPRDRRLVGVALRSWPGGPSAAEYARTLDRVCSEGGVHAVMLAMQRPGDLTLLEAVRRVMRSESSLIRPDLSPRESLALFARLDGLLAMRLHALIFGAAAGISLTAISYDPKVASLMTALGQSGRSLEVSAFDANIAADLVLSSLRERDLLRPALLSRAGFLSERALVNVDRALSLVGR